MWKKKGKHRKRVGTEDECRQGTYLGTYPGTCCPAATLRLTAHVRSTPYRPHGTATRGYVAELVMGHLPGARCCQCNFYCPDTGYAHVRTSYFVAD